MVKKLMSKLRQIRNKYVAKKVLDNKKLSDKYKKENKKVTVHGVRG